MVLMEKFVTCTVCDSIIDATSTKQQKTLQIPLFTKDSIETCIGKNRSCVFPTQNQFCHQRKNPRLIRQGTKHKQCNK